jgi:hypothetical protein
MSEKFVLATKSDTAPDVWVYFVGYSDAGNVEDWSENPALAYKFGSYRSAKFEAQFLKRKVEIVHV